jgi:hypothetical protein
VSRLAGLNHSPFVIAGKHVVGGSPATHLEYGEDGTVFAVSDDDPGPEVSRDSDFTPMCLGCLLEDWPEGNEALRIAREDGAWSA